MTTSNFVRALVLATGAFALAIATSGCQQQNAGHAVLPDGAVSALLGRLENEGARIVDYRTESALACALEGLNEEDDHDEVAHPHSVDRCVDAGRLWHSGDWARADSAGPR